MSKLSLERAKALAYLQQKMNVGAQKAQEAEERAFSECGGDPNPDVKLYRSCIRTTALVAARSAAQSPPPPVAVKMLNTQSLPNCKQCRSNAGVTFKFEQRRSGDEGMTAVYACSECNVFWT